MARRVRSSRRKRRRNLVREANDGDLSQDIARAVASSSDRQDDADTAWNQGVDGVMCELSDTSGELVHHATSAVEVSKDVEALVQVAGDPLPVRGGIRVGSGKRGGRRHRLGIQRVLERFQRKAQSKSQDEDAGVVIGQSEGIKVASHKRRFLTAFLRRHAAVVQKRRAVEEDGENNSRV